MTEPLHELPTLPPAQAAKSECEKALKDFRRRLFELQNVFYAGGKYGLLVIMQGMDTSGKDGTIRRVMSCMNPMGLRVKSFKAPTEEEKKHDFLWRVYPHIPARGMIQVFNRSYYEDVAVPAVHNALPEERLQHRINLICELENHLRLNDIHVLKFFLHISPGEQKERIGERLTKPHKRWKYSKEDEEVTRQWDPYMKIYGTILRSCNQTPWHVIPADKRWYRNYAVAKVVTEYMEGLGLTYPDLAGN